MKLKMATFDIGFIPQNVSALFVGTDGESEVSLFVKAPLPREESALWSETQERGREVVTTLARQAFEIISE